MMPNFSNSVFLSITQFTTIVEKCLTTNTELTSLANLCEATEDLGTTIKSCVKRYVLSHMNDFLPPTGRYLPWLKDCCQEVADKFTSKSDHYKVRYVHV